MAPPSRFAYDLFVSYAEADRAWVTATLLPALTTAGLHVCLPERDFALGTPSLVNTEQAIDSSRHTLPPSPTPILPIQPNKGRN